MAYHRLSPADRADRDSRIVRLYKAGLETYQLRDRFGITTSHVSEILRKSGVKSRGLSTYDYFPYGG